MGEIACVIRAVKAFKSVCVDCMYLGACAGDSVGVSNYQSEREQ